MDGSALGAALGATLEIEGATEGAIVCVCGLCEWGLCEWGLSWEHEEQAHELVAKFSLEHTTCEAPH